MAAAFEQSQNPAFANGLANLIIQLVETDYDFGIELANRYDETLFADRKFEFAAAKIEGRLAKGRFCPGLLGTDTWLIEPTRKILQNADQLIEVAAEKHDFKLVPTVNRTRLPKPQRILRKSSCEWTAGFSSRLVFSFDRSTSNSMINSESR